MIVGGDANLDGQADLLIGYDEAGTAATQPVYDLRPVHAAGHRDDRDHDR